MTYYIRFNGSAIEEHSYSEAVKWAKDKSIEYGTASIICEQMQRSQYTKRPVATLLWESFYENGTHVKRDILNTRFSDKLGEEIPVEDWDNEMEELQKSFTH